MHSRSFRTITARAVLLCTIGLTSFAAEDTNWFPILPWNSPPAEREVLKKIHDCGFTLAGFVPPSALDLCREAGLKAVVDQIIAETYEGLAL